MKQTRFVKKRNWKTSEEAGVLFYSWIVLWLFLGHANIFVIASETGDFGWYYFLFLDLLLLPAIPYYKSYYVEVKR